MVRSMTGFGRVEVRGADASFMIEIRSVNNRYLDVQAKLPRGLAALEPRIKKRIQEQCSRGRFDVLVARAGGGEKISQITLDENIAAQYVSILNDLKFRFNLAGDIDLKQISGMQDVITVTEVKEDLETVWAMLSKSVGEALNQLDAMRVEEGLALVRDITGRLETIGVVIDRIREASPRNVENARKRMTDTLSRLLGEQPDPVRIAQEIAILSERTDITEELTRLDSHLAQFRSMLDLTSGESIGRKLDFLLQEIGREANTIASKAMDASVSLDVVHIKSEIEKIREQVQNIE